MSGVESLEAENQRLHQEIRGLNGQLEGLSRTMMGLRNRLAEVLQENRELQLQLEEQRGIEQR